MTSEAFDPFKGSSGLFDEGTVTFTECRFIKDPSYVNSEGELMPVFATDLATDDPDVGESGVLENQFFSIGKGWEIEDGGAKVVRADGKPKGFNNSTYLQVFLNALLSIDEDAARARYESTGYGPQEAGYWEGLTVEVEQTEYETGGFGGQEKKTRTRLMPTAIVGWGEGGGEKESKPAAKKAAAKKAPAKKAPAKKAAAKSVAEEPAEDESLTEYAKARIAAGETVCEQIRAIADESEDTDTFMERCYSEVEGIDDSAEIQLLVDDVESTDSIWAEAVEAAG